VVEVKKRLSLLAPSKPSTQIIMQDGRHPGLIGILMILRCDLHMHREPMRISLLPFSKKYMIS